MNISIIIPTLLIELGQLTWLSECLRSCTSQTDDVVVWDDGSEISLERLAGTFPMVSFHNLGGENRGKSYARNQAVLHAAYDFIYPVDADDKLVDGALSTLSDAWDGRPVYGGLIELHPGGVTSMNRLIPFDCDAMQQHCISPVNVLHTRAQWDVVGGWNEKINLYEDWDYNARLFWAFGARKIDEALVYYRQHALQSTRVVDDAGNQRALDFARRSIQVFIRRHSEMCCGDRRSGNFVGDGGPQPMAQRFMSGPSGVMRPLSGSADLSLDVDISKLGDPGPGNVWVRYFGGNGMGSHGRRGMRSRKKYKVAYGGVYAVRKGDAVTPEQYQRGAASCDMVEINLIRPPITPSVPAMPVVEEKPIVKAVPKTPILDVDERVPTTRTTRAPVRTPVDGETSFGDLLTMLESGLVSVKKLKAYLDSRELTSGEVDELALAEQEGRKRTSVMKLLEKARPVDVGDD